MKTEFEYLISLINHEIDKIGADMKRAQAHSDYEEIAFCKGQEEAYNNCLAMIDKLNA